MPVVMARNTEIVAGRRRRAASGRATACPTARGCSSTKATEVEQGRPLAEWDPYTLPIITEKEGIANYVDLVEGVRCARSSTKRPASPTRW